VKDGLELVLQVFLGDSASIMIDRIARWMRKIPHHAGDLCIVSYAVIAHLDGRLA
jgi:hypothetical protein